MAVTLTNKTGIF
jgi:hypothetical protein